MYNTAMNIKSFELLVKTENAAKRFVLGFCFKNKQRFCPYCRSRKHWKLADGRRRCQRCKMTYHDFTRRWWNKVKLPMDDWLRIVKLFELELSARKIATQLELPYRSVWKAVMVIRYAIFCHADDVNENLMSGEIELDETYFGKRRKGNQREAVGKVPVFGIQTHEGKVRVELVPNVQAKALQGNSIKKVHHGNIVYTDKYNEYDSLMFCGYRHLKADHSSKFFGGKVYIDSLDGFWSWAKERLFKHHGISPNHFPLYLKELEFRYNHRDELFFNQLVAFLSDFIPELPDEVNPSLNSTSQGEI